MSEPGIFDDDREDALPLLVNIDRTRKRDRRTLPDRMVQHLEPLRSLGPHAGLEPGLVDDAKVAGYELALFELDISASRDG